MITGFSDDLGRPFQLAYIAAPIPIRAVEAYLQTQAAKGYTLVSIVSIPPNSDGARVLVVMCKYEEIAGDGNA